MAVSGTTTFTVTRDQIIESALRSLAVLEEGAQPSATTLENASFSLNLILKKWQSEGIKLWTVVEYTIPLVASQTSYTIGPSIAYDFNADKPLRIIQAFLRNISSPTNGVAKISLLSPGSGYSVIPDNPVSVTGGTTGASGAQFTMGFGGDPLLSTAFANSVLLSAGGGGYSIGDVLTVIGGTYVTPATIRVDSLSNTFIDLPMTLISQQEYNILGSKQSQGVINAVYYKPWRDYGEISVFLTPNVSAAATYQLHIIVQRPIMDITKPNENFDLPQEWFLALKWALVSELSSDYDKTINDKAYYDNKAMMLKNEVMDWDIEWTSTFFQPDVRGGFNRDFR
jgi:hypothetical protein